MYSKKKTEREKAWQQWRVEHTNSTVAQTLNTGNTMINIKEFLYDGVLGLVIIWEEQAEKFCQWDQHHPMERKLFSEMLVHGHTLERFMEVRGIVVVVI